MFFEVDSGGLASISTLSGLDLVSTTASLEPLSMEPREKKKPSALVWWLEWLLKMSQE